MNWKSLALVVLISLIGVPHAHAATEWSTQDYDLYPGDFNGDGKTDLLYIAKDDSRASGIAVSDASGGPNTPFQSWASNYLGIPWNGNVYRAAVADFNGDGKADILLQRGTSGDHYLLLANTAGKITDISQTIPNSTLGGTDKYRVLAGDINGDGRSDLFLQAMSATDASVVIYANASGHFTSGATQPLADGDLGFNWSAPRANLFLGDFNGDGKHDVLVQAKPKIVMIDFDIPIPVPTYPPNLNGVAYAQGGSTPFQLAYIRQWSRNDNGADWSPNTANIIVGDFDGNGRADVILQARNSGTPSRLLSGNATGMAFGAASTLAANVTWAASSYHLIAGNFDGSGAAGVYFQSISASGANAYANVITGASVSTTTHDPENATGVMPISAVGRTPGAAAVSPSGTAQYSIPFALPPGRNGLTPQLGLVYDSAAGRGVTGLGWAIAGTSVIARCEKTVAQDGVGKAVRGALDDGYCLDGNRLRLVSGSYGVAGSTYRTELNGFSRITALGATTNGPASFKVETVDGRIHYYGDTADSRIGLLGTTIVRTWALSRIEDRSQNTIAFSWVRDTLNGAFRLTSVRYTGTPNETGPYLVDFQYTPRADVNAGYTAGSKVQQVQRLMTVEITYQGTRVRRYSLQYDVSSATARERLTSVQECAGATLECLPPTTFTYQNGSIGLGALQTALSNQAGGTTTIDINGDGRDDLLYASAATNGTYRIAFANAAGGFNAPINTGVAVHAGSIYGDYNLDGKADVLSPISGIWWVKLGTATGLAAPVSTGTPATATGTGDMAALLDVNGDGYPDLVWAEQVGFQGGDAVRYRAGLTTGGFSGTVQTLVGPVGPDRRIHAVYWGTYRKRLDFNADGNRDFAVAFEERFPEVPSAPNEYSLSGYCPGTGFCWTGPRGPSAGNHPQFGDFNGDRKTDVFYWHQDGNYRYVFSTGVGTTSELIGPPNAGYMTWIVADWDGDGFDDAITPRVSTGTWHVMRSNGVSFDAPFDTQVSFLSGTLSYYVTAADFNGDGIEDIGYWRDNAGTYSYQYHLRTLAIAPPDVLSIAQDGYGTRATFTFSPFTNSSVYTKGTGTQAPTRDIAAGKWVVSRLSRTDGSGTTAESAIDFSYVGAREDGQGRGFLGFEQRIAIDRALGHDLKTIETFSQAFPAIGAPTSVEVRKSNGARLSYQSNTWGALSGGTANQTYAHPYISASTLDQHDLASGQKVVSIQTAATVDPSSGLAIDTTRTTTEIAGGLFPSSSKTERVHHTSVTNDTTNWCLGRPTTTVQTNSHTLNDGAAISRTTSTEWDAAACRMMHTTLEEGSATLEFTTTYGYDAFGNVSTETVSGVGVASRTTTVNWGTSGRFPQTITNALSQTTVNTWDAVLALPLSTTDPNNLTTNWQYDVFGRRTREVRPDQTSSNWTYSDCAAGCATNAKMKAFLQEKDANAAVIRSGTDYFDRWDRLIAQQSHLLTANDQVWAVKREYDARAALIRDYAPYLNGGGSGYRKLTYDAIGRITSQELIRPNQATYATTSLSYSGLQVTETDSLLRSTTRHLAAWGPVLRVTDAASGQVNYQYNAFDQLMQAADPASNVVSRATYNILGMRTALADMNMGTWSFTPNALGEVVSQTDANSQTTTFQYDLLGRLKTRTEAEGVSTWTWGTSAANKNIGRLASLAGPGYGETFTYDTYSRPSVRTITADTTYQFDYAYDSAGRLSTLTYPQSDNGVRFKAKYGYSGDFLSSVQDFTGNVNGTVLWGLNLLDARGNATSESFGNGLWVQNEFDPLTGLAITRKAGTAGQETNIQHWSHQWDAAGNLTSRQDLRQSLTESFGYDALYRLTTRTGPGGSMSIAYDSIGNIASKTGISGTFTYDTTRKHAVTSAGGVSYSYDHNGNMTSRGGATITWSSYNLPTMINAPNGLLAQFSYTPDRARWRQISTYAGGSTETTIYVGGLLEKLIVDGVTRWKHQIPTPSGQVQVVRRSDGTQQTLYVVTDHLGSTDATLDAAGSVAMRASFGVHGERRSSNWQGAPLTSELQAIADTTRYGYTGHEMLDNVNLVHMNGRVFDPAIGRFLSADPFIDGVYSTQGWNRYAYVHGRVMSATDPNGFSASRRPAFWNGFTDYWIEITDPLAIRNILGQFDNLTGPALAASEGEPVSVTAREDGIPALDPSSIPMPTLAPVDVYGACDALNEHLAQREQRRQDIDKLAEALQGADLSATAIEGILTEARRLPLGAQLVGVTAPGGWVWTHPSAGLSGPIMPSHGNALLNSAIRDTASTTLRYVSVAGVGIDGLQVGYEISARNYDRAAYNAADAAITAGAIRYSGGVGAMFAVGFKMIGGTDTLMKASYLGGLARACSAENGTYVP